MPEVGIKTALRMKAFETKEGLYNYKHLPALASFILEHDLDSYIKDQIALSYELEVPILKLFEHLKEEEKYLIFRTSIIEFLQVLKEHRAKDFLETSVQQWAANKHKTVG